MRGGGWWEGGETENGEGKGGREGGQAGRELEGVGRVMGLRVGGEGRRIKRGGGGGLQGVGFVVVIYDGYMGGGSVSRQRWNFEKVFFEYRKVDCLRWNRTYKPSQPNPLSLSPILNINKSPHPPFPASIPHPRPLIKL